MSIKIFVAWRVPINRLGEATDIIRERMEHYLYCIWKKLLNSFYQAHKDKYDNDIVEVAIGFENQMAAKQDRYPWDFCNQWSVGFHFWLDNEYAYIIPYGFNIETPDWFEDYHYQNQVDRDENISDEEWEERKQRWNELYLEARSPRGYTHHVLSPLDGFHVAFGDYTRKWVDEMRRQKEEVA